jgi:hypothetical protein
LGFLGWSLFRSENPRFWGWISLDFLGFSRPNRDLSTGYTRFSLEIFSSGFFPDSLYAAPRVRFFKGERDGLVMGQAYLNF